MASVIRVKRRITDDPAEALLVSTKRPRHADKAFGDENDESVLSFAGTIGSKEEPVSGHIKEAIRRKKLHKELNPHSHQADIKHTHGLSNALGNLRRQTKEASRKNRYRVSLSKRALDLECLDSDGLDTNVAISDSVIGKRLSQDISRQELSNPLSPSSGSNEKDPESPFTPSLASDTSPGLQKKSLTSDSVADIDGRAQQSKVKEDKMFCIFDIENDEDRDPLATVTQQSSSGITLNNVPMISKAVVTPPPDKADFVYDLYYTHSNLTYLNNEAVLTVEALCDEFVNENRVGSPEQDFVHDDSDDSNEEGNWRNDYPDEDPGFIENDGEDYDYAEDMIDTNFLNEDDSELLSYWMGTRCKVDEDSDDGEDEYDKDESDEDSLD